MCGAAPSGKTKTWTQPCVFRLIFQFPVCCKCLSRCVWQTTFPAQHNRSSKERAKAKRYSHNTTTASCLKKSHKHLWPTANTWRTHTRTESQSQTLRYALSVSCTYYCKKKKKKKESRESNFFFTKCNTHSSLVPYKKHSSPSWLTENPPYSPAY